MDQELINYIAGCFYLVLAYIVSRYIHRAYRNLQRNILPESSFLFTLFGLSIFLWALTTGLLYISFTNELKLFWFNLYHLGACSFSVLFFLTSLVYVIRPAEMQGKAVQRNWFWVLSGILFLVPVTTTILAFTNQYHHLLDQTIEILPNKIGLNYVSVKYAFWGHFQYYFSNTLVFGTNVMLLIKAFKTDVAHRKDILLLIIVPLLTVPLSFLLKTVFGPYTVEGFDLDIVGSVIILYFTYNMVYSAEWTAVLQEMKSKIVDHSVNGIAIYNRFGDLIGYNRVFLSILHYYGYQDGGMPQLDAIRIFVDKTLPEWKRDQIICLKDDQGSEKFFEFSASAMRDDTEQMIGNQIEFTEVTNTIRYMKAARTDSLTGLASRFAFKDVVIHLLSVKKPNAILSFFFIDLDDFKPINDTYGHESGDRVLQEFARRLSSLSGREIEAIRWAGDEFLVVSVAQKKKSEVENFAQEILTLTNKESYQLSELSISVTASCGVSIYNLHTADLDEMLNFADDAMYKAKKRDKGTFSVYTADH